MAETDPVVERACSYVKRYGGTSSPSCYCLKCDSLRWAEWIAQWAPVVDVACRIYNGDGGWNREAEVVDAFEDAVRTAQERAP